MKPNWSIILLLFVLALGAFLRLYNISEYMTFLGDEGRDMLVVKRILVDHKLTLLGPTASVGGFFLGPIYYYFMLPFVWIFGLSPVGPAVMVALFGIATLYLLYRFASELFGTTIAFVVSLLYAISPLVIAYSRSSWNPNIVPFFSLLTMYLLWKSVKHTNAKIIFWTFVMIGIGLQLHYVYLFLFPVVFSFMLLFMRGRPLLFYLNAFAGFLVGYSLFLAFELRHGFPNTVSIIQFIFYGKETGIVQGSYISIVLDVLYRLFGRLLLRIPPPEQLNTFTNNWQYLWSASVWVIIFLSISSIFVSIFQKKSSIRPASVLFGLWLTIPILLFGFYHKGIYDYYFGIFFTLPFLLVGLFLSFAVKIRFGSLLLAPFIVVMLWLNWQGMPFRNPGNNQLKQAQTIAKEALEKTDNQPFNFALLTSGNSDHAYRYFFEIWGNPPVTIENEQVDPERNTVTKQLIVICEQSDCKPLGSSLWEIAGFGRAEIVGQWEVSYVTIYKLVHYQNAQL